jgi:Domain of unknown function (DUF4249)
MKKHLYIALLALVGGTFVWNACSNDFALTEKWKDIPIVYGLLSISDTAHYIRVERAFIDPKKSALDIAQIADSLYYNNAVVTLIRESDGKVFTLNKIDGTKEGYPRVSGVFANTPNYLYKIGKKTLNLQGGEVIRLQVKREDGTLLTEATTKIIGAALPKNGFPKNPANVLYSALSVAWDAKESAKFFDVHFLHHYEETTPDNSNKYLPKTLDWSIKKSIPPVNAPNLVVSIGNDGFNLFRFLASGEDFFSYLGTEIKTPLGSSLKRKYKYFDIFIESGGQELLNYLSSGEANSGITGTEIIRGYTNLSNGYGLFSSRNTTKFPGFSLDTDNGSSDTLKMGRYTKSLNFQ